MSYGSSYTQDEKKNVCVSLQSNWIWRRCRDLGLLDPEEPEGNDDVSRGSDLHQL